MIRIQERACPTLVRKDGFSDAYGNLGPMCRGPQMPEPFELHNTTKEENQ